MPETGGLPQAVANFQIEKSHVFGSDLERSRQELIEFKTQLTNFFAKARGGSSFNLTRDLQVYGQSVPVIYETDRTPIWCDYFRRELFSALEAAKISKDEDGDTTVITYSTNWPKLEMVEACRPYAIWGLDRTGMKMYTWELKFTKQVID